MTDQQVKAPQHWRTIDTDICQFLIERDYSEFNNAFYVAVRYHIRSIMWTKDGDIVISDPYRAQLWFDSDEECQKAFSSLTKEDCIKVRNGSLISLN